MKTTLNPYLMFSGNAADAMTFYQTVLGGELTLQTYGDAGMSDASEQKDKVLHAALTNDALTIMASDDNPEQGATVTMGNNVHLSIVGSDEDELTGYWNKLAEDGEIVMPLEKQFWGDVFGMITDKFGVHWMINISSS